MKVLKILGVGVFTAALVVLSLFGLDYVLSDDTNSFARLIMHEMYEQEEIDSLIVGSSHAYSGLDPAILDKEWNQNTFSSSTSAQRYDTSFMLLREANRVADIDTCYFEISMYSTTKDIGDGILAEICTVSDFLRPSLDKFSYMLKAVKPEDYVNAFCRARRNWKSIYSLEEMEETVSKKSKDFYKNYEGVELKSGEYKGKGFIDFEGELQNAATSVKGAYQGPISEDFLECLREMSQYCRENDIELICFAAPLSEYTLASGGSYDDYYIQAKEVCEEYGVPYYDFNLAKPSVLDIQDSDFRDRTHLNGTGARKLTKGFADFFAGKIEEEEMFYESYAQKQEHLPKRFIGIVIRRDESKEYCEMTPIATKEDDYKYEVLYEDENKDYVSIQKKSSNLKFKMPQKGKTKLKIRVYDSQGNKVAGFIKSI